LTTLPSPEGVREAARTLAGIANRTPVVTSRTLDERAGASVFCKCESFQRSGSFKFRGAYNALSRLAPERRREGVLTYSSGNHAQAVALAGRLLETRVTVVMPFTAPAVKREATMGYGADIVLYDPEREVREEVAAERLRERGGTLIPPFDHPHIVAGQGTAGLELLEDVGELDTILVPCGGGGLLSGTALAATMRPGCRVIGVEPELADDASRTFHSGTLHRVSNPPTIADGLRTPSLGAITWAIIREHVADIRTVTEADIVAAVRFLWTRMKLVVEPSGAVGLAALLADPMLGARGRVGVLISGGNADLVTLRDILAGDPAHPTVDAR
jgi:threo-3-hydroxy-L-aspartate ammonia-lyase